jgi:glycosyltransferase involved in cell wall biosynthesis
MRLTWLSNAPWTATGYGCQTRHFTKRFNKEGYPTAVIANYGHQGSPINWEGILCFGQAFHPFCADVAGADSHEFRADAMLSFMDVWVMQGIDLGIRWIQWIPIDHDPVPPAVANVARTAYRRIAISKFGQDRLNAIGLESGYVPNAVETDIFKPSEMPDETRKMFQIPKDKFIVGMVAMNKGDPPRKAFWQNIKAFDEFHKKHPDTFLYLHTQDGHPQRAEQIDIVAFIQQATSLRIGEDVIFPPQHNMILGFPDHVMAQLYGLMDVHLLVSMGEGFGIPILEAQSCGTPVIVGDWTSMSELCFSGWKVDKKEAVPMWTPLQSWLYLPQVGAIVDRLEAAYQMKGNQEYRDRARKGALAYDADKVMEKYWKPELKRIEEMLAAEKQTRIEMNGQPA